MVPAPYPGLDKTAALAFVIPLTIDGQRNGDHAAFARTRSDFIDTNATSHDDTY